MNDVIAEPVEKWPGICIHLFSNGAFGNKAHYLSSMVTLAFYLTILKTIQLQNSHNSTAEQSNGFDCFCKRAMKSLLPAEQCFYLVITNFVRTSTCTEYGYEWYNFDIALLLLQTTLCFYYMSCSLSQTIKHVESSTLVDATRFIVTTCTWRNGCFNQVMTLSITFTMHLHESIVLRLTSLGIMFL